MTGNTKTLVMVVVLLMIVYFMCGREADGQKNVAPIMMANASRSKGKGNVKFIDEEPVEEGYYFGEDESTYDGSSSDSSDSSSNSSEAELAAKFQSRNLSKNGWKSNSYDKGQRGNLGQSNWDTYFDENNEIIGRGQTGDNDQFLPIDESGGNLAVFKSKGGPVCGSNQNCQPEDLFDVDKYLPQEVNDDWFEVQPEPISVKNRHLINITKPIGVNTIGTSMKNSSYDIRGSPSCPKVIISPFLNSSIEADQNLKPLF